MPDSPSAADRALAAAARERVRAFLADELGQSRFTPTADSWMRSPDPAFSRRLAAAGLVGTTIPTEYGGGGGTEIERFAIAEELGAAGAPPGGARGSPRAPGPPPLPLRAARPRKRHPAGPSLGGGVF